MVKARDRLIVSRETQTAAHDFVLAPDIPPLAWDFVGIDWL
jgi:hypothetical protein